MASQDTDPRGLTVTGADGQEAGTVADLWIDQMEMVFRYLEVKLASGEVVLLPMTFADISRHGVHVVSILGAQFTNVPKTKSQYQITMLEEEKISAYYGAGTLYATPARQEPLL